MSSRGAPPTVGDTLMGTGSRQLLAFTFGRDSTFEGQLVGALERMELAGTMRVLDGLFVAREPESGELSAISLTDSPPSRRISRILGFRLDPSECETATQRTLAGPAGETVRALGAVLTPGTQLCRREDVERLHAEVVAEGARARSM